MKKKAVFNWSGGKDSAHALLRAIHSNEYDIIALLTTVNRESRLSTMHNIPPELLEAQSKSIGIPLYIVELTPKGNMEDYSSAMREAVLHFKAQGVTHFIFGDIYLHDVRSYREKELTPLGIEVVEPLWNESSDKIMDKYLESGLKTIIVTTMDQGLGEAAIGKIIDSNFIEQLPSECDPNGENGEYHTFCYDGPIYSHPIEFHLNSAFKRSYDIKLEDGSIKTYSYWFAELSTP